MTAQISSYGRRVADPQTRTTANGTSMAMGRIAVSLPCNAAAEGQATFWLGVIAFGKQADALARHQKGDMVSVSGNMQLNQWKAQDGGIQSGYQVVADSVISARTSRPGSGKKRTSNEQGQRQDTPPAAAPGWDVYDTPESFDQRPPYDY